MLKVAYFLRKIQTLRVNNLRNPRTKNAKFSEYYFHLNTSMVPLKWFVTQKHFEDVFFLIH